MDIRLYSNFVKRKNSTKRPASSDTVVTINGELKDSFALTGLTVKFGTLTSAASVPAYNYAYVPSFGRYYFVTEWAYSTGFWFATLTEDVLATYKNQITASTQYVTRSANRSNGAVMDSKYPTTANVITAEETVNNYPLGASIFSGYYIMGVINDTGNNGSVCYYAMPPAAFIQLCQAMLSSISWAGISPDEISEELQKALINPMQYVVSCIRIPFNNFSGTPTRTIRLGWWSFPVSSDCYVVSSDTLTTHINHIPVPKHTDSSTRGAYLNLSPYSKYTLTVLPFGQFDLDPSDFANYSYLHLTVTASVATGEAVLQISASNSATTAGAAFLVLNSNIGVQIPTGQIAANLSNFDNALTYSAIAGGAAVVGDLMGPIVSGPSAHSLSSVASAPRPMYTGGGGQTALGMGAGRTGGPSAHSRTTSYSGHSHTTGKF